MKKQIISLILLGAMQSAFAEEIPRAKVTNATFTINGAGIDIQHSLDFCTGNYSGAQGVLWGPKGFEMARSYACSSGLNDCQQAYDAWMTKAMPDDPRLPTMLVIFDKSDITLKRQKKDGVNSALGVGNYEGNKIYEFSNGLILLATCGGTVHPPIN